MKLNIFNFNIVTSTNDVAIKLIKSKKNKTGFVHAKKQTKGRGTYGKKWISKEGNLFGSIFFPLKKNYPPFNEFSIINPVIISNAIKVFCNKNITIKWPNDIFINKKKVCGILQELVTLDEKKFLIIGFGINIISSPKIKKKYQATNILFESKTKPEINKIINLIIRSYEKFFTDINQYSFINFKKKSGVIPFK